MLIDQEISIAFNKSVAPQTFLLGLRAPEIAETARPGQFVMIKVSECMDPLLRRPFSISGTGEEGLVFILYRVVGRGTATLSEAGRGEKLSVLGPLGKPFDLTGDRDFLIVGGGIGIAPLLFLSQIMTMKDLKFRFMAGFGTANDIIPPSDVGQADLEWTLATDDGTKGRHGFVTDLLKEAFDRHGPDHHSLSVLACGPLPMLKKVAQMSGEHTIPCQVSLEANMACGLGACLGCAVPAASGEERPFFHVCKDGPVFPAESVNWKDL